MPHSSVHEALLVFRFVHLCFSLKGSSRHNIESATGGYGTFYMQRDRWAVSEAETLGFRKPRTR